MNDKIRTQISGKYSPGNIGVFQLREKLLSDGIDIAFPVGSSIIQYVLEFAVTVPHEATTPFHETEVEFYKEIARNPVQVTYNLNEDVEGYMRESTTIETAYALLCEKPIVLVRPISSYSDRLDEPIKEIVSKYEDQAFLASVDQLTGADAGLVVREIARSSVDYRLTRAEVGVIVRSARDLTAKYEKTWQQYQAMQR